MWWQQRAVYGVAYLVGATWLVGVVSALSGAEAARHT